MLDTLAGMNQKDSYQWPVLGSYCWCRCFRAVFRFIVGRPVLPGIIHILDHSVRCPLCNGRFPGPDSAEGGAVLEQVILARRCATTGAGVGPDSVQFLNKVGDMPAVGARGDSTGAVLGQGYGHNDRCRGPDSVNCLEVPQFRSCSSLQVVDIPVFTQRLILMVLIVQKTVEIPQLLVDTVADVPVVRVIQVLTCRLWVRQSYSHSSCSLRKSLRSPRSHS